MQVQYCSWVEAEQIPADSVAVPSIVPDAGSRSCQGSCQSDARVGVQSRYGSPQLIPGQLEGSCCCICHIWVCCCRHTACKRRRNAHSYVQQWECVPSTIPCTGTASDNNAHCTADTHLPGCRRMQPSDTFDCATASYTLDAVLDREYIM